MFKAWPKIPRLENEIYHITEKIDGTNACVIIQPYDGDRDDVDTLPEPLGIIDETESNPVLAIYAQSRTRLITPEEDNYGFARWVKANAEQLIEDLGEGYHFGEWWGQGIQRGYDLDHKRFSLFNPNKYSEICYNVPLVRSVNAEEFENTDWLQVTKEEFKEFGSIAAKGYMKPEGFVVYAEKAKTYWKIIIDK